MEGHEKNGRKWKGMEGNGREPKRAEASSPGSRSRGRWKEMEGNGREWKRARLDLAREGEQVAEVDPRVEDAREEAALLRVVPAIRGN